MYTVEVHRHWSNSPVLHAALTPACEGIAGRPKSAQARSSEWRDALQLPVGTCCRPFPPSTQCASGQGE